MRLHRIGWNIEVDKTLQATHAAHDTWRYTLHPISDETHTLKFSKHERDVAVNLSPSLNWTRTQTIRYDNE